MMTAMRSRAHDRLRHIMARPRWPLSRPPARRTLHRHVPGPSPGTGARASGSPAASPAHAGAQHVAADCSCVRADHAEFFVTDHRSTRGACRPAYLQPLHGRSAASSARPRAPAPEASHRSCQVEPGRVASQSSTAVRARRRRYRPPLPVLAMNGRGASSRVSTLARSLLGGTPHRSEPGPDTGGQPLPQHRSRQPGQRPQRQRGRRSGLGCFGWRALTGTAARTVSSSVSGR